MKDFLRAYILRDGRYYSALVVDCAGYGFPFDIPAGLGPAGLAEDYVAALLGGCRTAYAVAVRLGLDRKGYPCAVAPRWYAGHSDRVAGVVSA